MIRKTSAAIVLLLLVVAVAYFLWPRQDAQPPHTGPEKPPKSKVLPDTTGRKSPTSKPGDSTASPRLGGTAPQDARTNFNSVEVELEPDMSAFANQELPAQLDEATAAALAKGSLGGEDLLKALAVLVKSGEDGTKKAWEAVKDEHDPAAKLAVLRAAAAESDPVVADILKDGLKSKNAQLRYESVELVESLRGRDDAARRSVLTAASTADANTASSALGQLADDTRKDDLAVMFHYLDNPNAEVADSARGTIDFLVNEEFKSAAEAQAWWKSHAKDFDDELQENE
ncbi:hypothetical protein [Haloferula sp. BvORR071]|uniref:hypothetical protein n=1 Tax=Haloferula sp. BvORR071 TaxID=1396141 RepID=UPI002240F33E|nr:hypothetical protein [Haloferula sp. BvORR071]